jgi:hypothetical protein
MEYLCSRTVSAITGANYTGDMYGCHGSAQDESGLNSSLQPGQTAQRQVQQSFSGAAPSNPWNQTVMIPTGSDNVVEPSNNVQQATDDDDDDAQDTDADDDGSQADQPAGMPEYQQVYQQMMQNLNNAMQNASRNAAPQAGSSNGGYSSQCVSGPQYGRCR